MATTINTPLDLQGVFPAIFTPLKYDDPLCLNNSIDYEKAKTLIDNLIEVGVSGLVPMGTTGQSATVTPQQHIDFIKFTVEYVNGRVPVIAGAGSNSTRESVETMNNVQKSVGPLSFLCVTGYYNNPPQAGLVNHFKTLVKETGSNIVIYNVPGRTNSYLEPETIIELASDANIIGLKQAVDFINPGKMREDTLQILTSVNYKSFSVLTGEDDALYSMLNLGGRGMITATGNIPEAAALYLKLIQVYNEGHQNEAKEIQSQIQPFVKACFCRKNPIPLAALFNSPVYLPLVDIRETQNGPEDYNELMAFMETYAPSLKKHHQESLST